MPSPKKTCSCGKKMDVASKQCGECRKAGQPVEAPSALESTSGTQDKLEVVKTVNHRITSLEDLVAAADIDLSKWNVERWVCNKWDMASVKKKVEDRVSVTDGTQVTELFQVKIWLVRKSRAENTARVLAERLMEDLKAESRLSTVKHYRGAESDGGYMFEHAPFDLHMGKYTWDEETVTNYDVDIAEDHFVAALDYNLEKGLALAGGGFDRVLCVFGNDVVHMDSKRNTTTAGTPLDCDTRYIRVVRRAVDCHRWAIEKLSRYAPVDVVIVNGNHDELTSFWIGEVLASYFHKNANVKFDNSPKPRKYYEYGSNLLGFTHGDKERVTELPLAMARECGGRGGAWTRCANREWHIGHKHITEQWNTPGRVEQDYHSDKGIRIRRLTSLSGHDKWHTDHAYMDRRACESFVFHKVGGFVGSTSYNVDHFTGQGASK